jgi:aminoglycoside phosphotransferase family enzyme/predicted kinase
MRNRSADLVEALRKPGAYPWRPDRVDVIETHVSWVFLAGNRVVKVKRPVRYPFVDHRTVEQRHHSCAEEVRLNRRLTTGVYLGVVPITRSGAGFEVDGRGDPVEWATLMRRLLADRMLDVMIAANTVPPDLASLLAAVLIPFHCERASRCGEEGSPSVSSLTAVITDNLDELRRFAGALLGPTHLALIDEAMRAFVGDQDSLLARRVADGWVRDGHGDLRAEHVCLEPSGDVQVFDCVEFSPAIRCADVASDLAFLLMDLDRLGVGSVATDLIDRYRDAGVELPGSLLRFYRAHRALVRAKVAGIGGRGAPQQHPDLAREATIHLELASAAALTFRPFLIAMTGLSGTGKSTVAASLARATGAHLFASDVVRKQLAGVSGPSPAAWGEGLYADAWTERTYGALLRAAEESLQGGNPVILDASFLASAWRERAAAVAAHAGVPFLLVETVCDPAITQARIEARAARGRSASDATVDIYRHQQSGAAQSVPAVPGGAIPVRIDTGRIDEHGTDRVLAALREAAALTPRIPTD